MLLDLWDAAKLALFLIKDRGWVERWRASCSSVAPGHRRQLRRAARRGRARRGARLGRRILRAARIKIIGSSKKKLHQTRPAARPGVEGCAFHAPAHVTQSHEITFFGAIIDGLYSSAPLIAIAAPRAPERGSRWPKKRSEAATTIERLSVPDGVRHRVDHRQRAGRNLVREVLASPVKPRRRTRARLSPRRDARRREARRAGAQYSITDATGASVRHESAVSSAYVCRGVISGSESIDAWPRE